MSHFRWLFNWNSTPEINYLQSYPMPALHLNQSPRTCYSCGVPLVPMPNLEDFKTMPHANSSRIVNVTLTPKGFWTFLNYRGEGYLRSGGYPPAWFFGHEGSRTQLCCHQVHEIESIYGQFVSSDNDPDKEWIFTGYRHSGPVSIYFSKKDYLDDLNKTVRRDVSALVPTGSSQFVTYPLVTPTEVKTSTQIFREIQNGYRVIYKGEPAYTSTFPLKINLQERTVYELFHISTKTLKACGHGMESNGERIFQPFQSTNKRILVQAPPGYGKTFLTSVLAHQWAHGVSEIKNFSLCLLCNLLRLSFEFVVTQELVHRCLKQLKIDTYNAEAAGKALAENSESIVLLLDGYDMLPENHQQKLLDFVETSAVFSRSTILMTTRTTADEKVLKMFHKHVNIRGFSTKYLQRCLTFDKCQQTVEDLCQNFSQTQLYHLENILSPYFSWFVYKVTRNRLSNKSLFSLLEYVIQAVVYDNVSSASADLADIHLLDESFHKLGQLSFLAVVRRKAYFALELLRQAFGEHFELLVRWNIFCREDRDGKLWTVSSKLFIVFFATLYLRNKWNNLQNDQMRTDFLKNVFCRGECKGDYIQGDESLYYVGLIPEVVLKFGDNHSLESANFEMYHDVERIEHSTAFDSVNLLSRISGKFVNRFGFRTISESDDRVLRPFGWIFKTKTLSNFTVGNSFYTNDYEQKQFLAIDVKRDDDVVLQTVLRAKTAQTVDRIYIDFAYCVLDDVFGFIRSMLSRYLGGLELPDDIKTMSPTLFVFNLVWLMCGCLGERSATIICQNSNSDSSKILATLKMCWDRGTNQALVCVFDDKFHCTEYRKGDFSNAASHLDELFENSDEVTSDLRVSVNLFQSF